MSYYFYLSSLVCIYAVLAVSLNILTGYAGILSVCHAAFFGIGAYATAVLTTQYHCPWIVTLVIGILLAISVAYFVGRLSLRLRSDYLVVATFVIQVIVYRIMQNWYKVTMGERGIYGIPPIHIGGLTIEEPLEVLFFTILVCIVVIGVSRKIVYSPFGRILRAIREDEEFALSAGKNVSQIKILAFTTGAFMAALAGSIYAPFASAGHLDPSSFQVMESVFIIALMIIGGAGSMWGPVVGAALLIFLEASLRHLDIPGSIAGNMKQIIYGGALVAFMMWRPQGLLGKYAFRSGEAEE